MSTTDVADPLETTNAGAGADEDVERVNLASEKASGEKVVERVRQLMADEAAEETV